MGCAELFLKSASSTFTGYFLIVSIAFVVYGLISTYILLIASSQETLENEYVAVPPLCLALFGILLIIFITIGCCGVCREIPCCLETYSAFLIILASAQIGLGIFCLIHFNPNNPQFAEKIYEDVTKIYLMYYDNVNILDNIQQWLSCCGVTGPFNWARDNRTFPLSCCKNMSPNCSITSPFKFTEGCSHTVLGFITGTNYIIGWSCIIVGVTEVVAATFGITLSCAFWRNRRIVWI